MAFGLVIFAGDIANAMTLALKDYSIFRSDRCYNEERRAWPLPMARTGSLQPENGDNLPPELPTHSDHAIPLKQKMNDLTGTMGMIQHLHSVDPNGWHQDIKPENLLVFGGGHQKSWHTSFGQIVQRKSPNDDFAGEAVNNHISGSPHPKPPYGGRRRQSALYDLSGATLSNGVKSAGNSKIVTDQNISDVANRLDYDNPVAIVGMSCLPGAANSPDDLWELLNNHPGQHKNCTERYNIIRHYYSESDRTSVVRTCGAGFVQEDLRAFKNKFFGVNGMGSPHVDPQQRIRFKVLHECPEDSGAALDTVANGKIGIHIGALSDRKAWQHCDKITSALGSTCLRATRKFHHFLRWLSSKSLPSAAIFSPLLFASRVMASPSTSAESSGGFSWLHVHGLHVLDYTQHELLNCWGHLFSPHYFDELSPIPRAISDPKTLLLATFLYTSTIAVASQAGRQDSHQPLIVALFALISGIWATVAHVDVAQFVLGYLFWGCVAGVAASWLVHRAMGLWKSRHRH